MEGLVAFSASQWCTESRICISADIFLLIRNQRVRLGRLDEAMPAKLLDFLRNREDFRNWLDKEHPIRWAWDTFRHRRASYEAMFADPAMAAIAKHRIRRPREAAPLMDRLVAEARGDLTLPIPPDRAIL